MREGHSGKAEDIVCPFHHFLGQPQRTADHKHNLFCALHAQPPERFCQFLAGKHVPLYSQSNHISSILYKRKNTLPFRLLDLPYDSFSRAVGGFLICHLDHLQLAVPSKPLRILLYCVLQVTLLYLSHCYKGNLHLLLHYSIYYAAIHR